MFSSSENLDRKPQNTRNAADQSFFPRNSRFTLLQHGFTAVASDNLGATTTSSPVTVTGLTVIVIFGATNLPDGTFQFAFTNTPEASFSVLTSTNIATPMDEWTSAGTALETSAGSYQFTDETPS